MKTRKFINKHIRLNQITFFPGTGSARRLAALVMIPAGVCMASSCGGGHPGGGQGMQSAPRATVQVVVVKPASYNMTEQFPATLIANSVVQLRPDVTGYLEAIRAKDGSMVRKGQPLYDIDESRYQAAFNQTQASVQQAEADLSQKQRDYKRYQDLLTHDAIASQVVDQAGTAVQTAKANLAAAQASLSKASTDLNHATMRAPISGKLGIIQIKIGDIINAGQTLINTIVNDKPMYADFNVPQARIHEFLEGSKPASGKKYGLQFEDGSVYPEAGHLLVVDNSVDPTTGTIRIRLEFPNTEGTLKSGMNAVVTVNHPTDSGDLAVPTKAMIQTLSETTLYTLGAGNVVQVRQIQQEGQLDSLTIVKGLRPQDKVIVDGLQSIRPGDTVNVQVLNQ